MKIIIIGGGIGGLTLAIALAKVGIDAQIYERVAELREVGAGLGLACNALSALDVLGLGGDVRSQSVGVVLGALRNSRGDVLAAAPSDGRENHPGAVAIVHRAELLEILRRRIEPERLHLDRTCVGFEQEQDEVTARFHCGETVRGDVLVGADGMRSAVRGQLFRDKRVRYAGYTAWRAVVEFDCGSNTAIGETWGRGCRFGFLQMSRGRVYWYATNNAPEGERDPEGQTRDSVLRLFRGWHEPVEALIAATSERDILRNDIYDMDPTERWGEGRVVLLGDAAHAMTPNLGQGACQAIEDAVVLAACLAKNRDVGTALFEYQARRTKRVRKFVLQSRRLGMLAQWENPILRWIRDAAIRVTPKGRAEQGMKALLDEEILSARERQLFD